MFERITTAIVVGILLYMWAGDIIVSCSHSRCYNVSMHDD